MDIFICILGFILGVITITKSFVITRKEKDQIKNAKIEISDLIFSILLSAPFTFMGLIMNFSLKEIMIFVFIPTFVGLGTTAMAYMDD